MNKALDLNSILKRNSYPGRGIITGLSEDGTKALAAYFIMGRSENSRNRIFSKTEDGIRTEAFIPEKLSDPSLIIYHPVRRYKNKIVITNGDQTDTIRDGLEKGISFEESLMSRKFEPDEPNFTPRISALLDFDGNFSMKMSILKSDEGDPSSVLRYTFDYEKPERGSGRFIHTYMSDGNPLPSFSGEPEKVKLGNDLGEFTDLIWESLDFDNKISLFTLSRDIRTGREEEKIINKNM